MLRSWVLVVLVVGIGQLWVGSANGQEEKPESRFNTAVDLAKAGEHQKAMTICLEVLPKLPLVDRTSAYKLMGYSFRKLNMLPEAWYYLSQYQQFSARDDTVASQWLKEVEVLLKKDHVKITINSIPQGASLTLASDSSSSLVSTPMCPVTWWFLPGTSSFLAAKDGYEERSVDIAVKNFGDAGIREVKLKSIIIGGGGGGSHEFSRWAEWTLIGSGVALGAAGGALHFLGNSKNEELHDKYDDSAAYPDHKKGKELYDEAYDSEVSPKMTTAYILYGTGGTALLAGIITWAIRGPAPADSSTAWNLSPWTIPDGGGAVFTLGW
jgi:hypothetical protein